MEESEIKGRKVIELGAGMGLCGIGFAQMGAQVILTDQSGIVHNVLGKNIDINETRGHIEPGSAKASVLDWGRSRWAESDVAQFPQDWDVILCCDCLYFSE